MKAEFNEDFTQAVLSGAMNSLDARITIDCTTDMLEITYNFRNTGENPIPKAQEMCFQLTGAPHFRDFDGRRTFLSHLQEHISRAQMWNHYSERLLIQDYAFGETPDPSEKGPRIDFSSMATESKDGQWTVGVYTSQPIRFAGNLEYSCLHVDPKSPLGSGQSYHLTQKIYFIKGNIKEFSYRVWDDHRCKKMGP